MRYILFNQHPIKFVIFISYKIEANIKYKRNCLINIYTEMNNRYIAFDNGM